MCICICTVYIYTVYIWNQAIEILGRYCIVLIAMIGIFIYVKMKYARKICVHYLRL